ncbi:hypothetical protein ACHAQJ_005754 [Trichoderma viride]
MPLPSEKKAALAAEQQNLAAGTAGSTYRTGAGAGVGTGTGVGHPNAVNANLPGPAPFTAGPHRHDILNKIDPTVDSGTGGMQVLTSGANGNTATGGVPGQGGGMMGNNNPYNGNQSGAGNYYTMGTNVVPGGGAAAPRNVPEGTYGPHTSRAANAADPRIDSDADHRRRVGAGTGAHTGAGARAGAGVGAGAGTVGGAGAGANARPIYPPGVAGPAPTTAGPHRHDILNKLDPTVDSRSANTVDGTGRRVI